MALMWGIDRSGGHGTTDIGPEGAVAMAEGDWSDAGAAVPGRPQGPKRGFPGAGGTIVEYTHLP